MDESITHYLDRLKDGCSEAANELIQKYWTRVIRAASSRVNADAIRISDGEDIAVSVFDSLYRKAEAGKFKDDDLASRQDFWNLLSRLIRHKAIDLARREKAQRRGSGNVVTQEVLGSDETPGAGINNVVGDNRSPVEQLTQIEQEVELLSMLPTDLDREIVVLYLEGGKQKDIAAKVGLTVRTIHRKLNDVIKPAWKERASELGIID